jgi:hypothetical protein
VRLQSSSATTKKKGIGNSANHFVTKEKEKKEHHLLSNA